MEAAAASARSRQTRGRGRRRRSSAAEQRVGLHPRLAGGKLVVLLVDGLADGGDAADEQLLGDGALLGGYGLQQGVAGGCGPGGVQLGFRTAGAAGRGGVVAGVPHGDGRGHDPGPGHDRGTPVAGAARGGARRRGPRWWVTVSGAAVALATVATAAAVAAPTAGGVTHRWSPRSPVPRPGRW